MQRLASRITVTAKVSSSVRTIILKETSSSSSWLSIRCFSAFSSQQRATEKEAIPGDLLKWGSLGFCRTSRFASGFKPLEPKPLDSIMDLNRSKNRSPEDLASIWDDYHLGRGHIGLTMKAKLYRLLEQRGSDCRYFVVPLWRGSGYTTMFAQVHRRPENVNWVVLARIMTRPTSSSSSVIEIFPFDPNTTSLSSSPLARHELEESDGDPITIAVHPSGDCFVCSTTNGGCKLFELYGQETHLQLSTKELPPLLDAGPQKCLAFSVDGSRFAAGGVDGRLRILEWPTLRIIVDEVRAHKSFRDMDFSLDSEFLASTSTDGSARIWKTEDGVPLMTLARNSDEKIELCRFSKDGTKPFLFCTVQRGDKAVTAVYDISTWNKIGHKRLLGKPASVMSVSLDGKYLALGSKDGDICVVEVKKMEISHWNKRLHLGTSIASLEFCPSQRVVLTTSSQWGAMVTKLNVPADWKEWQIYLLLLGLFLASAVVFYIFFEKSDSFWNFPIAREQTRRNIDSFLGDAQSDDPNVFGPLDM